MSTPAERLIAAAEVLEAHAYSVLSDLILSKVNR